MGLIFLAGCGPTIHYIQITPPVGWVAFAVDRHIPVLEQPMRVGVYRPNEKDVIVHFDTAIPTTTLDQLPVGSLIENTGSVRSALGF